MFARGTTKAGEEIECRVLSRFLMEKPSKDDWVNILFVLPPTQPTRSATGSSTGSGTRRTAGPTGATASSRGHRLSGGAGPPLV